MHCFEVGFKYAWYTSTEARTFKIPVPTSRDKLKLRLSQNHGQHTGKGRVPNEIVTLAQLRQIAAGAGDGGTEAALPGNGGGGAVSGNGGNAGGARGPNELAMDGAGNGAAAAVSGDGGGGSGAVCCSTGIADLSTSLIQAPWHLLYW